MKTLSKLTLLASFLVFLVAIILSFMDINFIAGPNGWLDLSLICAVFSIAIKYVLASE